MENRVTEPAEPGPACAHAGETPGLTAAGPKLAGRADPSGQHARAQVGQLRRAAFAHRGYAGKDRRIPDRAGRESHALVAGDGLRPTVLVHGGAGFTIEWAQIAAWLDGPVVIPDRHTRSTLSAARWAGSSRPRSPPLTPTGSAG
jgi:hypothetical protein